MLVLLSRYTAALTEAVASGPYFKAIAVNLLPYQILQPWVDAAFKKRGIDPEEFWRNAGLPAFRFPDPNGTRLPNGAPPPAPPVLEEHQTIPGRPSRRAHRAPTPRWPTACPDRKIHCRAHLWTSDRSAVAVFRRRSTSRRRHQSQTACRRAPVSRSPAGRASRRRTPPAHRCRYRLRRHPGRGPRTCNPLVRRHRHQLSRPRYRPRHQHRRDPDPSYRPRSSRRTEREAPASEHHL